MKSIFFLASSQLLYYNKLKNSTLKAAQITEPNKPLKISEIDTPTPTGKQVVVKVKAVGVCHSDLHLW